MYKQLTRLLRASTVQQSIITVGATFSSAGLGAVYYIFLARILSSTEYGLFIVTLTVIQTASSVLDLGVSQGLLRFVGEFRLSKDYYPFAWIGFWMKLLIGGLASVIFLLFSRQLAILFFHHPEYAENLNLVGISVLVQMLFYFVLTMFQGQQRFVHWGILQVGTNVLRLVILWVVYSMRLLTVNSAIISFSLSYLLGFGIAWLFINHQFIKARATKDQLLSFWQFSKWTAAYSGIGSITNRLDTFMSARFLTLSQVGIYSLSYTMASFLPQLSAAIGAVTSAKFAGVADVNSEKKYIKKAILFITGISCAVALIMVPVALVVIKFTGRAEYGLSLAPFGILLVGMTVFMATNPIRDSIMYFYHKPQFAFYSTLLQAVTILGLGSILLPKFGVVGAALTIVFSYLVISVLGLVYYKKLK